MSDTSARLKQFIQDNAPAEQRFEGESIFKAAEKAGFKIVRDIQYDWIYWVVLADGTKVISYNTSPVERLMWQFKRIEGACAVYTTDLHAQRRELSRAR